MAACPPQGRCCCAPAGTATATIRRASSAATTQRACTSRGSAPRRPPWRSSVDTVSVDAGVATSYPVHRTTLPADVWHLEGLVNLDRLPPRGATVVIGVLPLAGGSGAPARVLALLGA